MKQRFLLVGADGHDLLNRISTLDLGRISVGVRTLGLILNPQGKIRASFWVTPLEANQSLLEFEEPFLQVLDQYTFAEKYELILQSGAQGEAQGEPASEGVEAERIQKLEPKLGHEFFHDEETNPLEINLRSAIHDQKGCYPGQEVIEKIIALGSPPRRLVRVDLVAESELAGGLKDEVLPQPLMDEVSGQLVGTLTSFLGTSGLAVVKKTHLSVGKLLVGPQGARFQVSAVSGH